MDSKLLAVLAAVSIALIAFTPESTQNSQFEAYKEKYGKNYTPEEEAFRFANYLQNMAEYEEHNAKGLSWEKGENEFSDLAQSEFEGLLMNKMPAMPEVGEIHESEDFVENVNWVTQGKVQSVKNQGSCGSCWAFSVTSTIESQCAIQTGRMPRLSEQQMVDCDRASGNMGCSGGWPSAAINFLRINGICTTASYPYEARNASCRQNSCTKDAFTVSGYRSVARGSTAGLQSACTQQPISVCVNASPWSGYRSGILTRCSAGTNHAVLLAGYTTSYWLLKNSWGGSWGESGYIRLGPGNECGLANVAVYSY